MENKICEEQKRQVGSSPAAFASMILSSPLEEEEKAVEEDIEPLLGSCTRLVVGSSQKKMQEEDGWKR